MSSTDNIVPFPTIPVIVQRLWKPETVLRAIIDAANDGRPYFELMQRAANEFGRRNGWSFRGNRFAPFDLKTMQHDLFDHPVSFNKALVVQPYGHHSWRDIAERFAADRRRPLEVHTPPVELASLHSPGHSMFIVFTQPGHKMKWLPEQMTGISPERSTLPATEESELRAV